MSKELVKSLVLGVTAAVVGVTGIALQARHSVPRPSRAGGQLLLPKLTAADDVASLEIIEVNEDLASLKTFKIAKKRGAGLWVVPSKSEYPADAQDRISYVATMFVDLKANHVASEIADDHAKYQVVEPSEETNTETGVGKLVVIQGNKNEDLGRLIIGGPVKGQPGDYFVRRPGQDVVYIATVDDRALSTRFADWIQKNLLDIRPFDVERVNLLQYAVVDIQEGEVSEKKVKHRMAVSLSLAPQEAQWSLNELLIQDEQGQSTAVALAADEELNRQSLNELLSTLTNLEIVDVLPKPEGLRSDLRAGQSFVEDEQNRRSLTERGFYPQQLADGSYDLKSANGEAHVATNYGVSFVLRFGGLAVGDGIEQGKVNRLLFVTASVDESKFPLPVKEQLPGAKTDADSNAAAAPAEDASGESQPPPALDPTVREAEMLRIEKEHQRQLDEREERLNQARAQVAALNSRFADWYYVVSEDTYKKIQLSRTEIIQKKAPEGDEQGG